jgi:hypothetical protein
MGLSLATLAGIYVLAVSSVLPQPGGRAVAPVAMDTAKMVIITPASDQPQGALPQPTFSTVFSQPKQAKAVAALPVEPETEDAGNCHVGATVMIPDGREGQVTSRDGDTCRVLAYGERYVSLWNEDMIEPVYPQALPRREFGH